MLSFAPRALRQVEEGTLRVGDKLAVRPGDESTVVKTLGARNLSVRGAGSIGCTCCFCYTDRRVNGTKGSLGEQILVHPGTSEATHLLLQLS